MLRQDTAHCAWEPVSLSLAIGQQPPLASWDLVSFLQTLRLCVGFPDSFDPREAMVSMLPLMARPLLKPRGSGSGIAKCCLQPQRWSPAFKATFWGETAAASSYRLLVELSV